jgi:hypothetical protein
VSVDLALVDTNVLIYALFPPAGRSPLPFTHLAESTASPWQRRGKAAIASKIRM